MARRRRSCFALAGFNAGAAAGAWIADGPLPYPVAPRSRARSNARIARLIGFAAVGIFAHDGFGCDHDGSSIGLSALAWAARGGGPPLGVSGSRPPISPVLSPIWQPLWGGRAERTSRLGQRPAGSRLDRVHRRRDVAAVDLPRNRCLRGIAPALILLVVIIAVVAFRPL